MKAEANPTKAVKFCKMPPAFGHPGFLWATELLSTLQVRIPCEVLAVKTGKRKIHIPYLAICRNQCRIIT